MGLHSPRCRHRSKSLTVGKYYRKADFYDSHKFKRGSSQLFTTSTNKNIITLKKNKKQKKKTGIQNPAELGAAPPPESRFLLRRATSVSDDSLLSSSDAGQKILATSLSLSSPLITLSVILAISLFSLSKHSAAFSITSSAPAFLAIPLNLNPPILIPYSIVTTISFSSCSSSLLKNATAASTAPPSSIAAFPSLLSTIPAITLFARILNSLSSPFATAINPFTAPAILAIFAIFISAKPK
ncbi:hypothetical protein M5K25_027640 [Dendrobium thyrsiflorum]|uniref:Uncharacterized protein n=1 Tax=Dendrobium thyrsiflorum TaxID=117978 RepID=A0ABD0TUG9_DENTH